MLYPPRGDVSDLLAFLARADTRGREALLPRKTPFGRLCVEPWFHLLGAAAAAFLEAIPAAADMALQDRLYHSLGGGKPTIPFAPDGAGLREAAALAARAEERTGRRCALLCLESHPPIDSDALYLNLELMRHALKGLNQVRGRPCRPRMVVAVDPFGIDMLRLHREGGYAGFMSRAHLGFDRLPRGRAWTARLLLRHAVWPSIAFRIARSLGAGEEVIMVLGGGMPATARLYYCAREWAGRLCRGGVPGPEFRRRLAESAPEFAAYLNGVKAGPLGRSAWRLAESWLLSTLCATDAFPWAKEGVLPPRSGDAVRAVALAAGLSEAEAEVAAADLRSEFARETPYRERLFGFLAGRVVRQGTPVLLLPLRWGDRSGVQFSFGAPVALLSAGRDRRVRVLDRTGAESERGLRDFARAFAAESFP